MTRIVVSFEFEGSNTELVAQVANLLQEPASSASPSKPRKMRILTDEQRVAFRARMIAGRAAKVVAQVKGGTATAKVDSKLDPEVEQVAATAPVKFFPKHGPSVKVPMPRTGRKVEAKPSSQ
jgi:hypothetical protein